MYTTITLSHFRTIKTLKLENLAKINLFFGKNNCGKTTILESLFLLSGMNNPDLFRKCNALRSYKHIKDFRFFFYNLDTSSPISFVATGTRRDFNRKATISFSAHGIKNLVSSDVIDDTSLNTTAVADSLSIHTQIASVRTFISKLTLSNINGKETTDFKLPQDYTESLVCNYLAPSIAFETIPPLIAAVLQDKKEKIVIDALRQIDMRIQDFVLFENEVMVDVGLEKRIPINMLGDGVRKFFTLVLALYSSKNGVLLVDEIDNGLHFSTMQKLWYILLSVANLFNVQLFATTHNIDSLKGLKRVIDETPEYRKDVALFKLLRREAENEALFYDADSFSTVIQQENEIR